MRIKFTDLTLKNLKTSGYVWDADTRSFGVYVGKNRTTFVAYKGSKKVKLGRYPFMSLKEARTKALLTLYTESNGSTAPLTSDAVLEYLSSLQKRRRTIEDYARLLNRHFVSKFGPRRLDQITTRDILSITDKMKHTPAECRHAHAAMSAFFSWCLARTYVKSSPLTNLPRPTPVTNRDRVLTPDELKQVWTAAEHMNAFGIIIKLLTLTGQRVGEISNIHKATITDDTITWPKELIKNRRSHSLPITTATSLLLKQFTATASISPPYNNSGKRKAKLDRLSGVHQWTLHDLRRTAATMMAEHTPPHVIERILNHVSGGSMSPLSRVYNRHAYLIEMREALERHECRMLQLVTACNS